jgi:hypothetical protein
VVLVVDIVIVNDSLADIRTSSGRRRFPDLSPSHRDAIIASQTKTSHGEATERPSNVQAMLQRQIGFVRPVFAARSALCATARIRPTTPLLSAAGRPFLVATKIAPAAPFHDACRHASNEPWDESKFRQIDRPDVHLRPERPTIQRLLRAGRLLVEDKVRSIGRTVQQRFLRRLFRRTPLHYISWTLYLVILVPGFYFIYKHYLLVEEQFSTYPKPIADHLRNALYYGTYAAAQHQNHDKTLQHYRAALELCPEHGLDPLSDEVLGIKVRIVEWMMKGVGNYESAIATLESTLGACLRGVAEMDRKLGRVPDMEAQAKAIDVGLEGQVSAATIVSDISNLSIGEGSNSGVSKTGENMPDASKPETTKSPTTAATPASVPAVSVPEENPWHRRRRLLHKAIQICLSLGWMFSDEHVLQPRKAQVAVSWAFEATMKELLRRRSEGVKEGEGDWMTPDEIGALLERMFSLSFSVP